MILLSIVIHPKNPYAPTTHCNFRYFELFDKTTLQVEDYWFGGGVDLTPYYVFEEDCIIFHQA
jgi:coproporphyrinogen III oxidase